MNNALSKALFDEQTKNLGNERLLQQRSWRINEIIYPMIDITFMQPGRIPFRIRLKCELWDFLPPSIELLYENGEFATKLPTGSNVLNGGGHPSTRRPFICSPGALEYHTHPSHINDHWENYKGKSVYDLGGILTQVWNSWMKTHD